MGWGITLAHKVGDTIKYLAENGETYSGKVYRIKISITETKGFIDYYIEDNKGTKYIISTIFKKIKWCMDKLTVTKERVLEVAKENPCAAKVLEGLFPEAFEDNRVFCTIGSLFKRKSNPNSVYAIFKWNGEVRILNVTSNYMWKNLRMSVSSLKDAKGDTLTVSEFKKLTGGMDDLSDFNFDIKVG